MPDYLPPMIHVQRSGVSTMLPRAPSAASASEWEARFAAARDVTPVSLRDPLRPASGRPR